MINSKRLTFTYIAIALAGTFLFNNIASAKNLNPKRKNAFNFVVMGDNRPQNKENGHVQPKVFNNIIGEVNLLDPEFAIILGDLIFGYSGKAYSLGKMWDEFDKAVNKFTVPYYLVIGNHDVSNQAMEDYYLERYGDRFPAYYSFNHKKSHFIILDCEIPGSEAQISGEQLIWLKKDLKKNSKAKHIFVFLHRPLQEDIEPTNWMTEIHPLMAKYNVNTVFAGHWHVYQKSATRDGVRYIITGGAGAPVGSSTLHGSFYHYLLVTVRDDDTSIALIKPGKITNEEIVNQTIVNNTRKMTAELTTIYLPKDMKKLPATLDLVVKNRFDVPVTGTLHFTKNKTTPWTLPTNNVISIMPGEVGKVTFGLEKTITTENLDKLNPVPRIYWDLNVGELNFNVASNRRQKLIVDDWPHTRDVRRLANSSVSVTPIVAQNEMTGNIATTVNNPLKKQAITVKTEWKLPENSSWTLPSQLTNSYDLKPGQKEVTETAFTFNGQRNQLFPLPHLKSEVFIQGGLAWQELRRLPIRSENLFAGKIVTQQLYKTKTAPKIDGILNDKEWRKCQVITNLLLEHADGLSYYPTEARLTYDANNLYMAIRCKDDDLENLRTKSRKHDGAIYNDDSIEIFIDRNFDKETYFQYVINAAGLILDGRNKNTSWAGPITSQTGREKDAWTLEVAIPWQMLDLKPPTAGSQIGFNISRNKMHIPIEHSQWSPTFGDNHTPSLFGIIEFK